MTNTGRTGIGINERTSKYEGWFKNPVTGKTERVKGMDLVATPDNLDRAVELRAIAIEEARARLVVPTATGTSHTPMMDIVHTYLADGIRGFKGSPSWRVTVTVFCKRFARWADERRYTPAGATTRQMEEYETHLVERGLHGNSRRKELIQVRKLWAYIGKVLHIREDNPMRGDITRHIDPIAIPREVDRKCMYIVSDAEEAAYFAQPISENHRDVARLILLQGCRPIEILKLKKSDVDLTSPTPTMHVSSKTPSGDRILPLEEESIAILRRRMNSPGPWVFPWRCDSAKRITTIQNQHEGACKGIGTMFRLYDFRHTFATRAAQGHGGMPPMPLPLLQRFMGHATIKMTMRYVHPDQQSMNAWVTNKRKLLVKPTLTRVA